MNTLTDVLAEISQDMSYFEEKEKLLNGLDDREIKLFRKCNAFLAGGAITSIFSNKPISDYDIFFRCEEDFKECLSSIRFSKQATTPNAITFKSSEGVTYQLIKLNFYSNPRDIFNDFDFSINCGLYDFAGNCFQLHSDFLKHIAQRSLVFNPTHKFPVCSLVRSQKYKERGYTLDQTNFFKIVLSIGSLSIKTNKDAAKQFQGMYFGEDKAEFQRLLKDETPFSLDKFLSVVNKVESKPSFGERVGERIEAKRSTTAEEDDLPF